MTAKAMQLAQKYLTFNDGVQDRKILDLVMLSKRHDAGELIVFLINLYREKRMHLEKLMIDGVTTPELDRSIGCLFRIHMALRTIRRQTEEEMLYDFTEQRTGTGG